MSNPETDLSVIAQNVLDESTRSMALGSPHMPQSVRDASGNFRAAIADTISIGRQLAADAAELHQKRDLIPGPGLMRLKEEAVQEAQLRAGESDRRAARALDELKTALVDAALPRVKPEREALARQELAIAIGDATGDQASARARNVAHTGSREAAAVLFTDFGRTLLASRGLKGRDLDETFATARTAAAVSAAERGGTAREVIASKALADGLGRLGAARGAAASYVSKASNGMR